MRALLMALIMIAGLAQAPASAEVKAASPSAFLVETEAEVAGSPEEVWRALLRPGNWWNSEHTFSGDARRMHIDPRAGGCFCERWGNGQSIEHARVVAVTEFDGVRTLRMIGALGPLQEMGPTGVLTFTVAPHASGAKLTMTYRVSGDPGLGLDALAPLVDGVLNEQFSRLTQHVGGEPAG